MNADPALPVSTTNGAGVFQKINSKSFPDDIREKFGYIIWSLHKTIPLFTKETYNSTKTEKFYSCFRSHLYLTGNFRTHQTSPGNS